VPLTVAFQMDHIAKIAIRGDSTFALLLEGERRGHRLLHYTPDRLAMEDGRVTATAEPLRVRDTAGDHFTLSAPAPVDLADCDVVFLRQDPPFDMGYITTTFLLERLQPGTLVVNDPASVRNAPEKLFVTEFAALGPPTLISRDRAAILAFRQAHGDVIVKPLYGNGGAGVFRIAGGDENLAALLELFEDAFRGQPFVVQRYLPEVRRGDKRIILVDGEAVGIINRVPAPGEARSNMHVGGRAEAAEMSARDRAICAAIGPALKARGLLFVGIDVIGDWLTEINVTSPTGIREVARFGGADIAAMIWDAVEARVKANGGGRP
jgi:glutathione synthase